MELLVRAFIGLVTLGLILGALCFVAWVAVVVVALAWRLFSLGARSLGWPALSGRSEAARGRFVEIVSAVAPMPHVRKVSPYEGGPST